MRARMGLVLSGHQVRVRELILRDKPKAMLEASPKGTVPVLILPGGRVIDESLAVMDWALSNGQSVLASPDALGQSLIEKNDGPFKIALDRYKYPSRYEGVDPQEYRHKGADYLFRLNSVLEQQAFLAGDEPGYADYAIFPFVRQFRIAGPAWFDAQDWPRLHPWLEGHLQSEIFASVMKKYPLWNDTQEEALLGEA